MTQWTCDRVVLARHGETEWNLLRRRQGQLDSPLTERGVTQARAVAAAVVPLSIDAVFASPLGRAATTARACADLLDLPVITIDELAEINHGEMAGRTNEEIEQVFPGELARRSTDKYQWRFPGGESYADADRRAGSALSRIMAAAVRRPLIVSHEMIGRMLLRQLTGSTSTEALSWSHPHNVIYEVDPDTSEMAQLQVS